MRGALLDAVDYTAAAGGDDTAASATAAAAQLAWTRRVNEAEAEYWTASSGERVADSSEVLGFECGGSQWVLETVRGLRWRP